MTVSLFRHAWGAVGDGGPWPDLEAFVRAAAADGYTGVEFPLFVLDADPAGAGAVMTTIEELDLVYMPMVMTFPARWADPADHLSALRPQLERAAAAGAPRVNAHTGADAFDDATTAQFLADTVAMADDLGVTVLHETHRSRPLYNPWRTARMVAEVPGLLLTADYSHWVCVAERLPLDSADTIASCAAAVRHIHARVGHAEGPQVPDPRDPAWSTELEVHEQWWSDIVAAALERDEPMAITPEFGPPPYLATIPHTGEPVADLTEVVAWMAGRLGERFG